MLCQSILLLEGVAGIFALPYTDVEIQASIVDTWGVEALNTKFYLAFTLFLLIVSAILLLKIKARHIRVVSQINIGVGVSTLITQVVSHTLFTNRVTELTGQTFGGMWGLF